jgi:predicted RNase H-like HicB family nuclease
MSYKNFCESFGTFVPKYPNTKEWMFIQLSNFVSNNSIILSMKIKVIVHEAEEGGYWAEVPSIPGCATQGDSFEELLQNLYEAIEGCLSVDIVPAEISEKDRVLEIAV